MDEKGSTSRHLAGRGSFSGRRPPPPPPPSRRRDSEPFNKRSPPPFRGPKQKARLKRAATSNSIAIFESKAGQNEKDICRGNAQSFSFFERVKTDPTAGFRRSLIIHPRTITPRRIQSLPAVRNMKPKFTHIIRRRKKNLSVELKLKSPKGRLPSPPRSRSRSPRSKYGTRKGQPVFDFNQNPVVANYVAKFSSKANSTLDNLRLPARVSPPKQRSVSLSPAPSIQQREVRVERASSSSPRPPVMKKLRPRPPPPSNERKLTPRMESRKMAAHRNATLSPRSNRLRSTEHKGVRAMAQLLERAIVKRPHGNDDDEDGEASNFKTDSKSEKKQSSGWAIAISDNLTEAIGRLTYRKGQFIHILDSVEDPNWWMARLDRNVGWIKASTVRWVTEADNPPPPKKRPKRSKPRSPAGRPTFRSPRKRDLKHSFSSSTISDKHQETRKSSPNLRNNKKKSFETNSLTQMIDVEGESEISEKERKETLERRKMCRRSSVRSDQVRDLDFGKLMMRLKGRHPYEDQGIELKEARRRLHVFSKPHKDVFSGAEFVDWIILYQYAIQREGAVIIGQLLLNFNFINCVHQRHKHQPFQDLGRRYYRFSKDEEAARSDMKAQEGSTVIQVDFKSPKAGTMSRPKRKRASRGSMFMVGLKNFKQKTIKKLTSFFGGKRPDEDSLLRKGILMEKQGFTLPKEKTSPATQLFGRKPTPINKLTGKNGEKSSKQNSVAVPDARQCKDAVLQEMFGRGHRTMSLVRGHSPPSRPPARTPPKNPNKRRMSSGMPPTPPSKNRSSSTTPKTHQSSNSGTDLGASPPASSPLFVPSPPIPEKRSPGHRKRPSRPPPPKSPPSYNRQNSTQSDTSERRRTGSVPRSLPPRKPPPPPAVRRSATQMQLPKTDFTKSRGRTQSHTSVDSIKGRVSKTGRAPPPPMPIVSESNTKLKLRPRKPSRPSSQRKGARSMDASNTKISDYTLVNSQSRKLGGKRPPPPPPPDSKRRRSSTRSASAEQLHRKTKSRTSSMEDTISAWGLVHQNSLGDTINSSVNDDTISHESTKLLNGNKASSEDTISNWGLEHKNRETEEDLGDETRLYDEGDTISNWGLNRSHRRNPSDTKDSSFGNTIAQKNFAAETKRVPKDTSTIVDIDQEIQKHWKYNKLTELGRGAFGCVFLAHNLDLASLMAVKRVDLRRGITPEIARELENEVNVMKKLQSPHIVKMFGCIVVPPNRMEIYMEYVDGNSLDSQLKVFGPFPEVIVKFYTMQIVQALQYCHGMGVIHRDIKGKNILVMGKGTIKLADFGSAKLTDGVLERHGEGFELDESFKFTPQWVAPEVLTGRWDEKVDIWSLGCVVLEMASARAPWHEKGLTNTFQIMYQISQTNEIPAISDLLSDKGRDFCLRCFSRDAKSRPSAQSLLTDKWILEMYQTERLLETRIVAQELNTIVKGLKKCGIKCAQAQHLDRDYNKLTTRIP